MENQQQLTDRLDQLATLLERTLVWLEERSHIGEVEKISATVEAVAAAREEELCQKLAAADREIAALKAAATDASTLAPPQVAQALRKTMPASTTDMLAKHGIGDSPVDIRTLDAALAGLSLEQRIAVKSQLLRAGAIA